jgi:hypothetical protein
LAGLWLAWVWTADRLFFLPAAWAKRNRWKIGRWLWGGFWRFLAALSVGYLVFDRLYETSVSITSPVSDPENPFRLPFTIANNSHLFSIRNIKWQCQIVRIRTEHDIRIDLGRVFYGTQSMLLGGQVLNIDCNVYGPTSRVFQFNDAVTEAQVRISLTYDVDIIFGLLWPRTPAPTLFTYFPRAATSQWIRGDFAR